MGSLDGGAVRFRYSDYRRAGASRQKTMTLIPKAHVVRRTGAVQAVLADQSIRRGAGQLIHVTRRGRPARINRVISAPDRRPRSRRAATASRSLSPAPLGHRVRRHRQAQRRRLPRRR